MLLSTMVLLDLHQFAQRHQRRRAAGGARLGQRVGVAGTHAQREQFLRCDARWRAAVAARYPRLPSRAERWSRSTDRPPTAIRKVSEIVSALMPCSAAFSLSMTNRAFGWSASIYQSVSTTPGVLLKMSMHLLCQREAALLVGPVDFSDERLQHRRAGRHFGHGDARTVFRGDLRDARPHAFGNVVTLRFAFAFRNQIDLHVGNVRAAAHEVMADQAVEVERRGHAGVNLVIGHFRFDSGRQRRSRARPGRCVPARCPRACSE